MNRQELKNRLQVSAVHPRSFHIGDDWSSETDIWCLIETGYSFEICYVERGKKVAVLKSFADESTACEAYYGHIMSIQHEYPNAS